MSKSNATSTKKEMSRCPGTNRYVPMSVQMSMPMPMPSRAYYYTEDNVPEYGENEIETGLPPYPQWLEPTSNSERERDANQNMNSNNNNNSNSPGTQMNAGPWTTASNAQGHPVVPGMEGSHREQRHHLQQQMHENGTPDITEIYRRKPEDRYSMPPEMMMPEDLNSPRYYYRPATISRLPRRMPGPLLPHPLMTPPPPIPPQPPIMGYYPHDEHHMMPHPAYETLVYHSTPQLHRPVTPKGSMRCTPQQIISESAAQIPNNIRPVRNNTLKPAVAVRTPRYFRRQGVYKRPSALCLPLSSEPDPGAGTQRPFKARLPSGMQVASPRTRYHQAQQQQQQQQQQQNNNSQSPRENLLNTPRSCPPNYMDTKNYRILNNMGQKDNLGPEEMERIQQIIDQKGKEVDENNTGDEASVIEDPEYKPSDVELILDHYNQIFNHSNNESNENKNKTSKNKTKSKTKTNIGKFNISQLLKPRTPLSIKQKRGSKCSIKFEENSQKEKDKIEIDRITSSVLDTLLHDLHSSGFLNEEQEPNTKISSTHSEIKTKTKPIYINKQGSKSLNVKLSQQLNPIQNKSNNFNFQDSKTVSDDSIESTEQTTEKSEDIPTHTSDNLSKIVDSLHCNYQPDSATLNITSEPQSESLETHDLQETLSEHQNISGDTNKEENDNTASNNEKKNYWTNKKQAKFLNDEHTALELHRSKSYIVNLIDRALSKELGTIPEEATTKEYFSPELRNPLDLLSSPAAKHLDNEMCLEITQALAESMNLSSKEQNFSASATHTTCSTPKPECSRGEANKAEGELLFSVGNDEPAYIKQLKKLRWGHLKHIQREMRRLEDLERFLDSCSTEK